MPRSEQALALVAPPAAGDRLVARVPFYYGWVMLPVAIAGQIATSPGQTYGISVFNDSFRSDLGLSHTSLTGAYLLGTLLAALPVALVGAIMDRHGIRQVMTWVVVLFGATCIATSQVTGLTTLLLAFFMLRMLGQGALTLLSSNTLAMWFHAKLGTASGLMSLGTAAAFALVPAANLYLIEAYGWRWAYVLLGLAVWTVMLPLLAILFRDRPEDVGQAPDGAVLSRVPRSGTTDDRLPIATSEWSLTLQQAFKTRAYWILLAMHMVWALVGTAIVFHIVALFHERGLAKSDVALFFTCFAVSMALAQLLGGVAADRCSLRALLFLSMAGMALSIAYLIGLNSGSAAIFFALLSGGSQGLFLVLGQTVWARYFGRTHLGKIRGTVWTACVAGSSIGPFALGVSKDVWGLFAPALWLFAILYGTLALAALLVTSPLASAQAPLLTTRGE